ncbi:hypothetical protein [Lacinutrix sp. MEBiC02404]
MNRLLVLILLVLTGCKSSHTNSENETSTSFEGEIKFAITITTTQKASKSLQQRLDDRYGDSLYMYYSKTGDFKRQHINTGKNGIDAQYYNANKGNVIITNKEARIVKELNVMTNSLKFLSKRKIDNEKIMGLDCACYEYLTIWKKKNVDVTLNYCFSLDSPEIDPELFSKHNDFFLNTFYEFTKRPYLKYSMETDQFKLSYSAVELSEKQINKKTFEVK